VGFLFRLGGVVFNNLNIFDVFIFHLKVCKTSLQGYNEVVRRNCKYKRENWEKTGRSINETKEG